MLMREMNSISMISSQSLRVIRASLRHKHTLRARYVLEHRRSLMISDELCLRRRFGVAKGMLLESNDEKELFFVLEMQQNDGVFVLKDAPWVVSRRNRCPSREHAEARCLVLNSGVLPVGTGGKVFVHLRVALPFEWNLSHLGQDRQRERS